MQDRTDTIDGSRTYSVLVVEDEIVVAMDLAMMIERNSHDVIGPATSVDAALRLLEGNEPDVAVLDANLRGRSVVPVAQRLRCMDVPFVLVSAYTTFGFGGSEVLEGAENVSKPFRERQLIEALHRATGPGRRAAFRPIELCRRSERRERPQCVNSAVAQLCRRSEGPDWRAAPRRQRKVVNGGSGP